MIEQQIFNAAPASPEAILKSRTVRADRQRQMLAKGSCSLISFTLNIPGPIKQFPLAHATFQVGLDALHLFFSGHILEESITNAITGSEALLRLDLPAPEIKSKTTAIENTHPLGRLFDMDVLDSDGVALSRVSPRTCFLCGKNAKICARSQAHTPEALQQKIVQIISDYFRDQAADLCAARATRALLYEVSITPKPGLVDRNNSGSHKDMDFFTFLDSGTVLYPWFRSFFLAGWNNSNATSEELFQQLRFIGLQAEHAMFLATGGINTHKGLVFSFGLLCGAFGALHRLPMQLPPLSDVLSLCQKLGACALQDLSNTPSTHGLQCYQAHRIAGVRGEAAAGFPTAAKIGLPTLQRWTQAGLSLNDAAAITLIALLAHATDTNMIYRGGLNCAERCQQEAMDLLSKINPSNYRALICNLDDEYIQKNLSPGGCADLLAITLMLFFSQSPPAANSGITPSQYDAEPLIQ